MYNLNEFSQRAVAAFYNTSFNPDRVGSRTLSDAETGLNSDVSRLRALGADTSTIDRYVTKYKQYFSSYLSSETRCASSFIVGPSNFPVARAQKASKMARSRYDEFQTFRSRVIAAIERRTRREQKAELGITPLIEAKRNLNARMQHQAWMKKTNSIIRQTKKKGSDEQLMALMEMGHTPEAAAKLLKGDWIGRIGFPNYELTNNNAQIRRLRERVEMLQQKEYKAEKQEEGSLQTEFRFEGGYIKLDYQADRLRIHHDQKPSADKIQELKRCGFKWSPSNSAWQRQLTPNARWVTERLTGVKC
ncbi:hypothetical protein WBJ53_26005 [Spirosoma sp. SC4-14]|uniref:hypothetical protein n=1 Tax=Spirosoma sp. SC4-14 TaxID=3128900 RepID=UPI0030D31E92